MSAYVILNNVNKKYKNEDVIREVSMDFNEGEITGIIGRNGSGKTVILKMICGLLKPDSGTVIIDGKAMNSKEGNIGNVGAVIENPGFIPYKSGFKNLKYLAYIQKKIGKAEIKAAMNMVGLNPDSPKHVGKYSLGMKQRLAIAQAIMEDPQLLILDEPMNGLDQNGVADIRLLLNKLKQQGKTIIITSHQEADIELLCDKVYAI